MVPKPRQHIHLTDGREKAEKSTDLPQDTFETMEEIRVLSQFAQFPLQSSVCLDLCYNINPETTS